MSLSERARVALRMATERLSKLQDELSAVRTENTRLQEENGALRRQSDEQATEIAVLRCENDSAVALEVWGFLTFGSCFGSTRTRHYNTPASCLFFGASAAVRH